MVFPPRQVFRFGDDRLPAAATTSGDTGGSDVPYRRAMSSEAEAEAEAAADAEGQQREEHVRERMAASAFVPQLGKANES